MKGENSVRRVTGAAAPVAAPFMGVLERRMLRADAEMEVFWEHWRQTRDNEKLEGYARSLRRANRLRRLLAECLLARVDATLARCEWVGGAA